jgi:hypothetical protein
MFKVKVTGPDGALCRISLPQPNSNLQNLFQNAGVQTLLSGIKLARPDPTAHFDIEIKARDNVGRHLLRAFSDTGTLEDLNNAVNMVSHANRQIKAQLKEAVLDERFHDAAEMKEAVREMSLNAGKASETYYFPLAGSMWSEEYGEYVEMDESYIAEHAREIGKYFAVCSACDMESRGAYYKGPGADKLLLADWGFEALNGELYGKVDVRLSEPMTEKEESALRDWIRGVNSDGIGRSFERQPVSTGMGGLHISLWTDSEDYFICDADEMQEKLEQHQGIEFGGM